MQAFEIGFLFSGLQRVSIAGCICLPHPMTPEAQKLWRAPQWAFSILLALLGMLGPFSIDTYLPAFAGISQSLGATPVQMQQTLSAYLFGFAFMALFHGSISDSFGRRPVVLWGLAAFTVASIGCALSQSIGQLIFFRAMQGLCTGAGIVISRAVIRDVYPPSQAQKVMSQVTIFFGVAPAIAPMVGGWLLIVELLSAARNAATRAATALPCQKPAGRLLEAGF
jgi:DHA1 family bicyclomycin/chloramphenicol resistance-like MFS transporter